MRVEKNERGRWEIGFIYNGEFGFEANSADFATRAEAERELRSYNVSFNNGAAAERKYQSQIAYVCGERD